jgi:hypothetical protein
MKSAKRGKLTLGPDCIHITPFGIWLLVSDREYYASFENFPWFKGARVEDVFNVEIPHPGHLFWPTLDIDLSLEVLEYPDRFPLIAKTPQRKSKR